MKTFTRLAILLLSLAIPCLGGDWHVTGSLRCGDCHYQHGTLGGFEAPGGPFSYMLKKSSVNDLCLSCHDGSDPTAPDVLAPAPMYTATPYGESSAGPVTYIGNDHLGHSMGVTATVPLQSSASSMTLSCASCHAVHGNGNFRNLLVDPGQQGDSIQVSVGIDLFQQYAPTDPPTAPGSQQSFQRGNVLYKSQQYTAWCVTCHDQLATTQGGIQPAHFSGHPSNVALNSMGIQNHGDPDHWRMGVGAGFPDVGTNSGIPRVPALRPAATDFITASTATESDQVFCLSCHKAHGSANRFALLWPYAEGGDTYVAACQQCHNK